VRLVPDWQLGIASLVDHERILGTATWLHNLDPFEFIIIIREYWYESYNNSYQYQYCWMIELLAS
jgi:hypothetical protein